MPGVPIAMGTDTGTFNNPGQLAGLLRARRDGDDGQSRHDADAGARRRHRRRRTRHEARGQLGTIQPGKWADLVVLNANPLTDIRNTQQIHSVWIAGRRLNRGT